MSYRTNRLINLNRFEVNEKLPYVIYLMHSSIRVGYNFALQEAIRLSEKYKKPLKVIYHLYDYCSDYHYRQYHFLLQGLKEVARCLQEKGIGFEIAEHDFRRAIAPYHRQAALWVLDKGYLRYQQHLQEWFASHAKSAVFEVEDNLLVPVQSASNKPEWMARTIRPRIMRKLEHFAADAVRGISHTRFLKHPVLSFTEDTWLNPKILDGPFQQIDKFLKKIQHKRPMELTAYEPGEVAAIDLLDIFLQEKLATYDQDRNHPELKATSHLSPYLHFGMISPLFIYKQVRKFKDADVFIEQVIVRRELAYNYVFYTPHYDRYTALPSWARKTLRNHKDDERPYLYDREALEQAKTHDPYWNAAMTEMLRTGYMENVMRMYWGKKVLEWSKTPEIAFETLLYLNNKYFLDGSDANSFVGVAWCFGLHDRPWVNRPIFGSVRYMNDTGLKRKFKIDLYVEQYS